MTVYVFMLILDVAVFMEFMFSYTYFLLTQIKLLVFFLVNITVTLLIIYMIFMASKAVKGFKRMIVYTVLIFIAGVSVQIVAMVYIEKTAMAMIE